MSVFVPYDGWEDDVRAAAAFAHTYASHLTPAAPASERLLRSLQPPPPSPCAKRLRNADGSDVLRTVASFKFEPLVCKLPSGHEPPCVPDVPEEEWR